MATTEAPIHEAIKQELVKGTERDTALIMRTFRNTSRIFKVIFCWIYLTLLEFSCSKGNRDRERFIDTRFQKNPAACRWCTRETGLY